MKSIFKLVLASGLMGLLFSSCEKDSTLMKVNNATASVLTSSATTLILLPSNANNQAVKFSFDKANYNVSTLVTYTLQMDKAGNNFSKPKEYVLPGGAMDKTFITSELNTVLLGLNFVKEVAAPLEVRVKSNLGISSSLLYSNVTTLTVTPFDATAVLVALPASGRLFIVGDATDFGWSNSSSPAFPPEREFTRMNAVSWGGIFKMTGASGATYKVLQEQGNWGTQFRMIDGGTAVSGMFKQENANPGFPSPAAGIYKVVFNFQTGSYTTEVSAHPIIANLYITGNATNSGWTTDATINQKLKKLSSGEFEGIVSLKSTGQFKFLTGASWDNQVGGSNGNLVGKYSSSTPDPAAIDAPTAAGDYKVNVNFLSNTYKITKL